MSDEDLRRVRELLSVASTRVSRGYFLLPIADPQGGQPLIQYRERVYAYELYHQLRSIWPAWRYSLAGEVDKRGHPVVHGGDLDNAKPDLLVHVPGDMAHNLLAVEIKAARPDPRPPEMAAIHQDIRKLVAFRGIGYRGAILLVFGEAVDRIREFARRSPDIRAHLNLIELYHHPAPGTTAEASPWDQGEGEQVMTGRVHRS